MPSANRRNDRPDGLVGPRSLASLAESASPLTPRVGRQLGDDDLSGALSHSGYGKKECKDGIPVEQALAALLAAFTAAFGFLFRAVTQAQARRRRRKREAEVAGLTVEDTRTTDSWTGLLPDLAWMGRCSHARSALTRFLTTLNDVISSSVNAGRIEGPSRTSRERSF